MKNRKYPWSLFFFGVATNFIFHFFFLFIPGAILILLGFFSQKCLALGITIIVIDFIASIIDQVRIRNAMLSDSSSPGFQKFQDKFFKDGDWKKNVEEYLEENSQKSEDTGEK